MLKNDAAASGAQFGSSGFTLRIFDVADDNGSAFAGHHRGDAAADAAGGSGDDGDFVQQSVHGHLLSG